MKIKTTNIILSTLFCIFCAFPAYAQKNKKSQKTEEKIYSLPQDLEELAGDPALLKKPENLTVAAYVFPNYNATALHNKIYAKGWTEYNLTRSARPWFDGHQQPRTPLLGELDESLPSTWETYNKLATRSGIDVYIWDWYWYDGKPCLHEALENGFLEAPSSKDMKFACMWTNHDWYILYQTKKTDGGNAFPPSYPAADFSYDEAYKSLSYMVSRYCHLDNYWKIDGNPVLCIWDAPRLEAKLGFEGVKRLFSELRAYAKQLGHPGLHLHVTGFYAKNMKAMGYNSVGSYNPMAWAADRFQPKEIELPDFGVACADLAFKGWQNARSEVDISYIPAFGVGWDSTPRFIEPEVRPDKPNRQQWPGTVIFKNESPAAFKALVQSAFVFLNKHPEEYRFLTVACFNEWSEGHSLLPDNRFGYGMLDALGEALGKTDMHLQHGK